MNPGFSFGSYVSGTSCVHRLDPRTKYLRRPELNSYY